MLVRTLIEVAKRAAVEFSLVPPEIGRRPREGDKGYVFLPTSLCIATLEGERDRANALRRMERTVDQVGQGGF